MQLTNRELYDAAFALTGDAITLARLSRSRQWTGPEYKERRKELRDKAKRYDALSLKLAVYISDTFDQGTAETRRVGLDDGGMRHILIPE